MPDFANKRTFLFTVFVIAVLGAVVYGCRSSLQGQRAKDREVLAKINDYRMTVLDFKQGANFILATKYLSVEPNEAKEELLDELIARTVLLQEAQKQNLDKEKAFMKEIEKYWGESLLKLLIEKKSEEISKSIHVDDSEVIDEYARMKRRIFAQLLILNNRKAAEKLSAASYNKFDQVKESVREQIVSGESPEWWALGDLPRYLEEPLFSLKVGEVSSVIKCGNNWAAIRVIREEKTEIEPYKNLATAIRKSIHKRKKEDALDKWIEDLKKGASIKINTNTLNKINLE